jgi:prolyl-tRNA synthetase
MAEKRGFIVAGWCGNATCEARIKEETRATVRVIPLEGEVRAGVCVRCGEASPRDVYFAQAY